MRLATIVFVLSGCYGSGGMGTAPAMQCQQAAAPAPNVSGRYQLVQLGNYRRDQYLLDTNTGRLWTAVCPYGKQGKDGLCDALVFQSVDVLPKP